MPAEGDPKPVARSVEDPVFHALVNDMVDSTAAVATAAQENRWDWMMPTTAGQAANWDGGLFYNKDLSKPFNRQAANDALIDAIKDPTNAGVTNDGPCLTAQLSWVSALERAFRARHAMRAPRAVALAMGRMQGHGHANGLFRRVVQGSVAELLKRAKS